MLGSAKKKKNIEYRMTHFNISVAVKKHRDNYHKWI